MAHTQLAEGNLLDQSVDAIVNAWNRNIILWWLLLLQGVSGAIKKRAGLQPFKEIAKAGPIPLGNAVLTSVSHLPYKGVIHVVGLMGYGRASEFSIRASVRSALAIAGQQGINLSPSQSSAQVQEVSTQAQRSL